jgi:hypothetical protein
MFSPPYLLPVAFDVAQPTRAEIRWPIADRSYTMLPPSSVSGVP